MKTGVFLALAFIGLGAVFVRAEFVPSHSCSKPYKPYKFTSRWEIDGFNNEVRSYKSCVEDFVQEQEDAIKKHRQSANEAIDEWNSFVRYELR